MTLQLHSLRRARLFVLATFDLGCWVAAYAGTALLLRQAGLGMAGGVMHALVAAVSAWLLYMALGVPLRLHQGRSAVGSFDEVVLVGTIVGVTGLLMLVSDLAIGPWYRTIVAVGAPCGALVLLLWGRALHRLAWERLGEPWARQHGRDPVVVIGAGEGGRQLVGAMLKDPATPWAPVALLDDDPMLRHRRFRGVPCMGRVADLPSVAAQVGATTAVLAIPSAPSELLRRAVALATDNDIDLKVLPSTAELLQPGRVAISDVRDINVADLLGRHQIDTDLASIAGYLAGRRVLVTGAGGSIGSELCRQIAKFHPCELMMLDRDESALHAVELSIYGTGLLDSENTILGDIRDTDFILDLFETRRPEVVFHAAALKHLPLLEKAPGEAVKTNVWGTLTVLEAAARSGVAKFVNVSTDKAANPTSALGYSKRLAEGLTAAVAGEADGTYLSVRFGNVLGSRGSVLTAFAAQIANGGPVTVTDPRVTRYFMTIQEAVQLVIQAGAIGRDGEVLVLDMGEPVSIDSVARQLIDLSGDDVGITYTGLRPGEKMHEELFGDGEPDLRPVHHLISHVEAPPFAPLDARALDPWSGGGEVLDEMRRSCLAMAFAVVGA